PGQSALFPLGRAYKPGRRLYDARSPDRTRSGLRGEHQTGIPRRVPVFNARPVRVALAGAGHLYCDPADREQRLLLAIAADGPGAGADRRRGPRVAGDGDAGGALSQGSLLVALPGAGHRRIAQPAALADLAAESSGADPE